MNAAPQKNRNRQRALDVEYLRCSGGMRTCCAVVCVEGERRPVTGRGGLAGVLSRPRLGQRRLIVRARGIGTLQRFVQSQTLEWLVRRFVCQVKFLPGSQPDGTGYRQLLDCKVVLRLNQLLLPLLEFYLGSQRVNGRRRARLHLVRCLVV